MELDAPFGEAGQLFYDVRHARIVEEDLSSLPRRRVDGDVKRREPVLENALEVALLEVRQGREVPIGERQTVVVVAHIEILPKTFRVVIVFTSPGEAGNSA